MCALPAGDPAAESYACPHTFAPSRKLFMIQDFSHNLKKLRNSVISSGTVAGEIKVVQHVTVYLL